MRGLLQFSIVATVSIFIVALLHTPVLAVDSSSKAEITLSPAKYTVDKVLQPGAAYEQSFKLINSGTAAATFRVSATPYSVQNEQYDPDYSTHNDFNQLSRWISFTSHTYTLLPNQHVMVHYTINTPASIPGGDQYAMLMAEMVNEGKSPTGNQVQTKSRVGIKLMAHTAGDKIAKTTVELSKIPPIIAGNRHDFPITFSNDGNVDFEGTYTIKATNVFNGALVFDKTQTVQVLPNTKRALSVPWDIQQNIGIYRIELSANTTGGVVKTTRTILAMTTPGLIAVTVVAVIIISGIVRIIAYRHASHTTFRKRR